MLRENEKNDINEAPEITKKNNGLKLIMALSYS